MFIGRLKNWFAGVLYFNKQERNGIFLLSLILAALVLLRISIPWLSGAYRMAEPFAPENPDPKPMEAFPETPRSKQPYKHHVATIEKFVFDPNTVSLADAVLLGFSPKLGKTLERFRQKGGKFRKAEDLRQLYGMSPALYASLEPYILIPREKPTYRADTVFPRRSYIKKQFPKSLLELNTADSLAIVYLRGIGPGFTKRILKYRSLLGGFHSVGQLKEIYGMNDSTYEILASQILIDKSLITKLAVNSADVATLRKHPYLNFQLAQALVNFRNKHGKLTEADVVSLGVIPAERLNLLLPYLEY